MKTSQINMPQDVGLKYLTEIIKKSRIAERMGFSSAYLGAVITHKSTSRGVPHLTQEALERMNCVIQEIGKEVSLYRIIRDGTELEQLKKIGKLVWLPYLLIKQLGFSKKDFIIRTNCKDCKMYGVFTNEEIMRINVTLRIIGETIQSIHLTSEFNVLPLL